MREQPKIIWGQFQFFWAGQRLERDWPAAGLSFVGTRPGMGTISEKGYFRKLESGEIFVSASDSSNPAGFWEKWGKYLPILSLLIALLAFLFGSGAALNAWRRPELTYEVLSVDIDFQYVERDPEEIISLIRISNEGRSAATDLEIVIDNVGTEIIKVDMPGPHESVEVISGGTPGSTELRLRMNRMTAGTDLSIFLFTNGEPDLEDSILITSAEMKGRLYNFVQQFLLLCVGLLFFAGTSLVFFFWRSRRPSGRRLKNDE